MDKAYKIQVSSDADYNNLISEVYIDGEFVALISQEDGPESLKIELSSPAIDVDSSSAKIFDLKTFLEALEDAKAALHPE